MNSASAVNDIADRYVERVAALNPLTATYCGISGYDDKLPDMSPEGYAAAADLDRATLAELSAAETVELRDLVAKEAMQERLGLAVERYDAGDTESELSVLTSGLHSVRQVFDLMPTEGEEAQHNIAARLALVPGTLKELRRTLLEASARGRTAAVRQVEAVARQCVRWTDPASDFYAGLVERTGAAGPVRAELDQGAASAREATVEFGRFLESELLPHAPQEDAVGRERYARSSRDFLGATVDLDEAYAWGWTEVARLQAEMARTAEQIVPGGGVDEAVAALDADPARKIFGAQNLRSWMQEYADRIIGELDGTHFELAPPTRRIEAMIAPTHDGGIYYTPPSEDFTRSGQMWWSVPEGVEEFSTWQEVSTIHHEGVPGHHLQCTQALVERESLNRWQRVMCWVSGHGEGWALYSERLMEELGYLGDPGNLLGMLDAQLLRACRVVVDLGVHLKLTIPEQCVGWHEGEVWNAELAWEFLRSHVRMEEKQLRFELDRYLGWPGQAPSYKLGERIWLQAREEARARKGADFSLKQFHGEALALGSLGLDPLRAALARL
ncbi:MAG TPA: DUF885 domain-containing protein [Actinocrinis sp.]